MNYELVELGYLLEEIQKLSARYPFSFKVGNQEIRLIQLIPVIVESMELEYDKHINETKDRLNEQILEIEEEKERFMKIYDKIRKTFRMKYYTIEFDPKYVPEWEVTMGLQELKERIDAKYLPKEE